MFVPRVHGFCHNNIVLTVNACPQNQLDRCIHRCIQTPGMQKSISYMQAHFSWADFLCVMENFPKLALVSLPLWGLCSLTSKQGDPTRPNA